MRLFLSHLLALCAAQPLAAQIPYDTDRNQGIGVTAGMASGAGISYQEILPSAFGYRGAAALWKVDDFFFLDAGASGLRVLRDDGDRRIYLVGSLSYWRRTDEETEPILDDNDNVIGERVFDDVDDSWSLGFGAGIEVPFGARAGLSLEALFTYWAEAGDLLPLPQAAIHYHF